MKYPLKKYLKHFIFFTVYGCVKYIPPPVGCFFRYLVLKSICKRIVSARIMDGVTVWFPEDVSIGKNTSINENCFLDGYGGIEIGDNCSIAHGVSILSESHEFRDKSTLIKEQGKTKSKIFIGNDVWIGCKATILQGVTIGDGAVISSGTVVNRNVKPYTVVAGVPMTKVGERNALEKNIVLPMDDRNRN
jgi:acetyltransferase-like isoleucine patch superfamily enzyme